MSGITQIISDDGSTGNDVVMAAIARAMKDPDEHGFFFTVNGGQIQVVAFHRIQTFPLQAAKQVYAGLGTAIAFLEKQEKEKS